MSIEAPFEAQLITPDSGERTAFDDTIAIYAVGIDANIRNTGNRVQEMANRAGVPVVMTDLLPQGKPEVYGQPNRTMNQPTGDVFIDMSRKRVEYIRDFLSQHDQAQHNVLLMADSLSVPIAQGMQLHADQPDQFSGLLLRDGWNLGFSEAKGLGFAKYAGYQAVNILRDLGRKVIGKGLVVPEHGWEEKENWETEYGIVGIAKDSADIMRSHATRQNAVELAGRSALSEFGLNVVCLEQGLSGSPLQLRRFIKQLRAAYGSDEATGTQHRLLEDQYHPVTLKADIVPGWHSDLLDPVRGAKDVRATLDLVANS